MPPERACFDPKRGAGLRGAYSAVWPRPPFGGAALRGLEEHRGRDGRDALLPDFRSSVRRCAPGSPSSRSSTSVWRSLSSWKPSSSTSIGVRVITRFAPRIEGVLVHRAGDVGDEQLQDVAGEDLAFLDALLGEFLLGDHGTLDRPVEVLDRAADRALVDQLDQVRAAAVCARGSRRAPRLCRSPGRFRPGSQSVPPGSRRQRARVGWATIAASVVSIVAAVLAGGIGWSPSFKRDSSFDRRALPEQFQRCLLESRVLLESVSAVELVTPDEQGLSRPRHPQRSREVKQG